MRKILKHTCLLLVLAITCATAQVKNGETVPDINFTTLLNAPVKSVQLSALKGKVVLVEFWATWCGSCIVAMPHLNRLQQKYAGKLQVITITDETARRTGQFLSVRPSKLWFAIDTGSKIAPMFPHQLIPHTVLISGEGKLIANTSPELVTDKVIDSILNKQQVHLAEKRDNIMGYEDLLKTYFFAADTVKSRFTMQPQIKGAPGLSTTWLLDSVFNGRRITAINLSVLGLYRVAYGNFPFGRIILKQPLKNDDPVYCLDIIVENRNDLLPTLQNELLKRFDLQARLEQQDKDVYLLKIADTAKFNKIPLNTSGKRNYYSRHGEIDQQNLTMTDFADYLENYGTGNLPVINETGSIGKFDIKFSFQPENPASLTQILSDMGLVLEKQRRKTDMLVIYKNQ